MNKIYSHFLYKLKLVTRLNLILVKNLLRGNTFTKKYVLYFWFKENLRFIFPYNNLIMYFRIRKIRNLRGNSERINKTLASDLSEDVKMVYINLDARKDRFDHMQSEFNRIGLHSFERFSAIKHDNGALGCALSHLGVLEEWDTNNYSYLLVSEDDVRFEVSTINLFEYLNNFINEPLLDVFCLGFSSNRHFHYNKLFNLSNNIQSTTCYFLKKDMKTPLINSIKRSIFLLENEIDDQFAAIDVTWKRLQNTYNFAIPNKKLISWITTYSDISKATIEYDV